MESKRSRFTGVSWYKAGEKWEAYIRFEGKQRSLGYFHDENAAAHAYDAFAIRHGVNRPLNFPHEPAAEKHQYVSTPRNFFSQNSILIKLYYDASGIFFFPRTQVPASEARDERFRGGARRAVQRIDPDPVADPALPPPRYDRRGRAGGRRHGVLAVAADAEGRCHSQRRDCHSNCRD